MIGISTPSVQVKEPYGNLDMATYLTRLSSCNPECTKYIPVNNAHEGLPQYIEIDRYMCSEPLECSGSVGRAIEWGSKDC